MSPKSATLRDVAALSGVSVPTVSKVLNGRGNVSEETRARILAAADSLDFRHNALARSFATGRSLTVGVLAQKATGNFSVPVITGIIAELSRHDVAVLVYDDGDSPAARPANIRTLQARRVDGVIVVGDMTDYPAASLSEFFDVPVIHAFGRSDDPRDTCLLPDDEQAGRLATRHLLDIGRRRIAHITASASSSAVQARARGLRTVLDDAGLPLALGEPRCGDWSVPWGFHATMDLAHDLRHIDAIVCGNDYIALGAARALERLGLRVPDDIAIVGYDNWGSYSGSPNDFLTSIDPRLGKLGRLAARVALGLEVELGVADGVQLRPCELVPGQSTGAVPLDDIGVVLRS